MICGFPGKSTCHGGLGWSSVVLIGSGARAALVDVGNLGMRKVILEQLVRRGSKPADVTDLLLTHSHYNWTLFSGARIAGGAVEMTWALKKWWDEIPVPELYARTLDDWATARRSPMVLKCSPA